MSIDEIAGESSSPSARARASFAEAVRGLIAHRASTAEHVREALAADPAFVEALVLRGFGLRFLGRAPLWPEAQRLAERARSALVPGNARAAALVEALERWCADDGLGAADVLDQAIEQAPGDVLLAKLCHSLRFLYGDSRGMERSTRLALDGVAQDAPARSWLLGCRAFALCECGELDDAERAGREAVEREPRDVWAVHAVGHVFFMRGDHQAGADWLGAHRAPLEGGNVFSGHVAWHEALCHVELGNGERALAILDERVSVYSGEDYREASDASSLLFRLEQRGFDVGDRWERWVAIAREREGDHGSAFADTHFALALAAAGAPGEASRFARSMQRTVSTRAPGLGQRVSREVGVPLVEAIAEGSADAFDALTPALHRIGGSHAQRALCGWIRDSRELSTAQGA